jgi:hypothetical protein
VNLTESRDVRLHGGKVIHLRDGRELAEVAAHVCGQLMEYRDLFCRTRPSFLVDRMSELSPNGGSLLFVYPNLRDGRELAEVAAHVCGQLINHNELTEKRVEDGLSIPRGRCRPWRDPPRPQPLGRVVHPPGETPHEGSHGRELAEVAAHVCGQLINHNELTEKRVEDGPQILGSHLGPRALSPSNLRSGIP